MRINRYLTHAVVLAVALAISGFATIDRHAGSYLNRLGTLNAQALVVDQGGALGNVSFGRYSTIIQPVAIPTTTIASHTPSIYTVQVGENLAAIAAKFHVTVSQLRWSNSGLFDSDAIVAGEQIVIPPVPGVVVTVKAGDTVQGLANAYQVDAAVITDYNRLRDPQLSAGTVLVIPGGIGPAFPPPPALYQQHNSGTGGAMPTVVKSCCLGPYPGTGFPVGWCTYYVATWRNVTWRGDAGWWYENARAQGYPVGSVPKVGAIMVTWESYLGHVAYVESVNSDGSWTVSEMNYVAFDVIDWRTIKPSQLGSRLVGFIYG
ncbi:MAG: LysM peptidoglycan-binding domain-containing protein [Chloroflexi bacterium]|nr:MAG: LysM peptidoglycan-binding domain-containing protein [Chloroflexota bacterium]TME94185.1 MAG: LysM peptidoglycan-binding domain-containing protein [Chloroflexota bacterium]